MPVGSLARLGLVLVLVAVIGYAHALALGHATVDFYSAAAQIIPVLLLVLALQARLFRLPNVVHAVRVARSFRSKRLSSEEEHSLGIVIGTVVLFLTLLTLMAGEYYAIDALATGDAADGAAGVVYTALAAGFVAIAYLALFTGESPPA